MENKHVRFEDNYDTLEDYYVDLDYDNKSENSDTNDSLKDTKATVDFLIKEDYLKSDIGPVESDNESVIDHENTAIKKETIINENNTTEEYAKELFDTEFFNIPTESISEKCSDTTEKVQFERLQNIFYEMESLKSEYSNMFNRFHVSRPLLGVQ